jgi:multidrug resistance efflux pump
MKSKLALKAAFFLIFVLFAAACTAGTDNEPLSASGTISAAAVDISPQVSGEIEEVYIQVGDPVRKGDLLFSINDEWIQAQYDQAAAGLSVAQAALTAAQEQKNAAEVQLAQAQQGARFQQIGNNLETTSLPWPDTFTLPQWYFSDDETLQALQAEVVLAQEALSQAITELSEMVAGFDDETLSQLEADLAQTQVTYLLRQQQLFNYQQSNPGRPR